MLMRVKDTGIRLFGIPVLESPDLPYGIDALMVSKTDSIQLLGGCQMEVVSCTECNTDIEISNPRDEDAKCPECAEGPFCMNCLTDVHECGDESDDEEDEEDEEDDETE